MFVNDTMIENKENPMKRYREKYYQLIERYKNLRNESLNDAGFPPNSYMKESFDEMSKYSFISLIRWYLFFQNFTAQWHSYFEPLFVNVF